MEGPRGGGGDGTGRYNAASRTAGVSARSIPDERVIPGMYMKQEGFDRLFKHSKEVETPCVIVDLQTVRENYQELAASFPASTIYYAVKANPQMEICSLLASEGSCFDIASIHELDHVLSIEGVDGTRVSYGNTIKKAEDVQYAYRRGVRMFATDSELDLRNIAIAAPGCRVYVRILTEGSDSADWPLNNKFGCHPDMAMDLLILARELGLVPYGVSFHVGSQQRDIATWDATIAKVKVIFERLALEDKIFLKMINMGGGLPANYMKRTNELAIYAQEITRFLEEDFGENVPQIIVEPGRSLVGGAGMLVTECVLVSRKSHYSIDRWVYVDAGVFNGLIECLNESIKYPIWIEKKTIGNSLFEEVIIAGPSCDSMDIMYQNYRYKLPTNLTQGDRLYFLSAGAYTWSYASVAFNGFPPLQTHVVPLADEQKDQSNN